MSQTWTEWQIVVGRKVFERHGTEKEARRSAATNGINLSN